MICMMHSVGNVTLQPDTSLTAGLLLLSWQSIAYASKMPYISGGHAWRASIEIHLHTDLYMVQLMSVTECANSLW